MPDCTTALNCCPGDNSFDYEIAGSALLNLATSVSPADGGSTTGDGQYALGAEVTVTATPAVPTSIDVGVDMVWVVDESGLGGDSRALMLNVLPGIEAEFQALGVGSGTVTNRYALVGHAAVAGGTHDAAPYVAHTHFALGDFAGFLTSIGEIERGGSNEDAYEALSYTAANMAWRETSAVAKIIVFISDEDRNVHRYTTGGATQELQFDAIKAELVAAGVHVVGILSVCNPEDGLGNAVMGFKLDPDKTWRDDGAGGFTNGIGGTLTTEGDTAFGGEVFPTGIRSEYGNLVLDPAINGEFWDRDAFSLGVGTCDTNGTAVTRLSGQVFTLSTVVGGTITINYVDYTVDSITDGDNLTLTASAGVQSFVDWSVVNISRDAFLAAITDSISESVSQLLSWTFAGWYNAGGELISTNASHTFNIQNHTTLEARFTFEGI